MRGGRGGGVGGCRWFRSNVGFWDPLAVAIFKTSLRGYVSGFEDSLHSWYS